MAIDYEDVIAARDRIRPFLRPTPLRHYGPLDDAVGHGVRVLVKHENHQPTNAFKVRNAFSALTLLDEASKRRGVIAATRGNHGQGLAYAGKLLGVPVTLCVPVGNNPEKNAAMRSYGAHLLEKGRDYDEAADVAQALVEERGMTLVHSTNDRNVIAGAATISLEVLEEEPEIDAFVVAVGGGSQAVGAITVARRRQPSCRVLGVQAETASAIHDSWHQKTRVETDSADTFADGLGTRHPYEETFAALRDGLAGFVTVSEHELASAVRLMMRTTHNLCEGAGAGGLAGLRRLASELAGQTVVVFLSGSNIDRRTLERVVAGDLATPGP